MKGNHQFSIAVHMMTCLGSAESGLPSSVLATSINTSPSFIRRTLSKLSKANLVKTTMGKTGTSVIAKDPSRISMLDIYRAVEAPEAFAVHQYPTQKGCPVSCKIKPAMVKLLDKTQAAMEESLKKVSLAQVIADTK